MKAALDDRRKSPNETWRQFHQRRPRKGPAGWRRLFAQPEPATSDPPRLGMHGLPGNYRPDDLTIDRPCAEVVRYIFGLGASGLTVGAIVCELVRSRAEPQPVGGWNDDVVRAILRDKAYIGGTVVKRMWDGTFTKMPAGELAIVDQATYDKVRGIFPAGRPLPRHIFQRWMRSIAAADAVPVLRTLDGRRFSCVIVVRDRTTGEAKRGLVPSERHADGTMIFADMTGDLVRRLPPDMSR